MHEQDVSVEMPGNGQADQGAMGVRVVEPVHRQSLVSAVWAALRQARIERLEARLQRLRQTTPQPSCGYDRHVLSGEAQPTHGRTDNTAWTATLSTQMWLRPRSWWLLGGVATVFMIASVLRAQIGGIGADAEDLQAVLREVAALRDQITAHAASVDALGQRLAAVAQQASDAASQLTSQTSVLSTYGQQLDAQAAQLTSLEETTTVVAEQVHRLDQKSAFHETQISAHEKQLATQATRLSTVRSWATATTPRAAVATPHPGPPMLETFTTPPTRRPVTQERNAAPGTAPDATAARPVISLPAGLGAAGLRGRPGSQQGAQP